jgi:hypothetical protein
MFAAILKTLSTPAAKTVIGVGAFATTCYLLRKSGAAGTVVEGVSDAGRFVTNAAVIATAGAIDTGCVIADTAILGANATVAVASKGVETVGYGVGRSARAVLDVTSKAGKAASGNPLSRGVMAGFYAPEAQAQAPVAQQAEALSAPACA